MQELLKLFRKGYSVANPGAWKTGQNRINSLYILLGIGLTLMKSFGYNIEIDDATLLKLAGLASGVIGVGNMIATTVSSKHAGVGAKVQK